MRKVHDAVEKKQTWMNEQLSAQAKLSKHQTPAILAVQIRNAKEVMAGQSVVGLSSSALVRRRKVSKK